MSPIDKSDLLENVINATTNLIFYKDLDFIYSGCNDAFAEFVGIPKHQIIGKSDFALFDEKHAQKFRQTDHDVIAKKETIHHEKWVKYPDGRDVYQHTTKSPLYDHEGNIIGMMGISRDMTVQKQLQDQLLEQHNYIQSILDSIESLIFVTADGVYFTDHNKAFAKFFGSDHLTTHMIPSSDVVKREGFLTINGRSGWLRTLRDTPAKEYKIQYTDPERNEIRIFAIKLTRLATSDEFMVTLTDITTLEAEKVFFEKRSKIDALTEIYNRSAVIEHLNTLVTKFHSHAENLSIIMIDIDHFKTINDTYGHQGGDTILHDVAEVIGRSIRRSDIFGRYGGEEFLLVLPFQSHEIAMKIGEKIRMNVEKTSFYYNARAIRVSVSLGIATLRADDDDKSLLKRADDALYRSKASGRNRITDGENIIEE